MLFLMRQDLGLGQKPIHIVLDIDTEIGPTPAAITQQSCSETHTTAAEILSIAGAIETFLSTTEALVATVQYCSRIRKRHAWIEDYRVIEIEDPITYFALFANYDPTTFESAVKEEKWRKTMDNEIDVIERNDT